MDERLEEIYYLGIGGVFESTSISIAVDRIAQLTPPTWSNFSWYSVRPFPRRTGEMHVEPSAYA